MPIFAKCQNLPNAKICHAAKTKCQYLPSANRFDSLLDFFQISHLIMIITNYLICRKVSKSDEVNTPVGYILKPVNLRSEQAILTMKARFSLLPMVEGFHELSINEGNKFLH